ncbi:MAG: hypothetical protein K8R02_00510 [Anaerohalosphaeraceae bacterium]|nr:hypothetical protein [Anaerohalosphaeraceae bacterium]
MKTEKIIAIVAVGLMLSFFAGCGSTVDMTMNLAPQSETVYKVVKTSVKDYEFIQPGLNKELKKKTLNTAEITFAQNVTGIEENGNAAVDITIKAIKVVSSDPKGTTIDFDSTRAEDGSKPLSEFVGRSYKIEISKSGVVTAKDISAVQNVLKGGLEKRIAARLFKKEEIQKRHQVMALMSAKQGSYAKGDSWSVLAASPPGMLKSKSYEKVYTVEQLNQQGDNKIAVINMKALPSSKRAPNVSSGQSGMGFLANMFDEQDDYTGRMEINLTTGQIQKYYETLEAQWVAIEQAGTQKNDKGPDQLTMGLTSSYSIETVN